MAKEIFINTQIAVFFNQEIKPELFISEIIKEMGDIFDQSPLTIPVPNNEELGSVPVVQFVSSNGLHSCNIARRRVDYYHFSSDRERQYGYNEISKNFLSNTERLFAIFSSKHGDVNRIGFLTKFFWEDIEQGKKIANLISGEFVKIHGGVVRDAKLQYLSRINSNDEEFEFNDSTTIEKTNASLFENSSEKITPGILITRDFNTIPEKVSAYKGKFDIIKIKNIIKESEDNFKLEDIRKLLWQQTP